MIFFDENNPNKYNKLKKLLVPYDVIDWTGQIVKKKRFGCGDGGYVLSDYKLDQPTSLLSYGVGNDPKGLGFEQSFEGEIIHLYDGSVEKLPVEINGAKFFKEHLTKENFAKHASVLPKNKTMILKMDVEGCEYEFLNGVNLNICATTFDQIVMEVHGLIEEIPEGWIIEAAIQNAKNNLQKKCEFFEKLNNHFHLIHIHGNNHSPRYVDFPDSLELTYINRNLFNKRRICKQRCPDPLLDQPNFDGRAEYVLDYWI